MKSRIGLILLTSASLFGVALLLGQTNSASSQDTPSTNRWKIVSQPKHGNEGPVVAKDSEGNTTVFGDYETKQTAPDGKVLQWYQFFSDADGRCVIDIVRTGIGDDIPAHGGIQLITYRVYRADGNIAEKYEFFGNGPIRQHVIYRYNSEGKWLKGDIYDPNGKHIGSELTEPDEFMYGDKHKGQH